MEQRRLSIEDDTLKLGDATFRLAADAGSEPSPGPDDESLLLCKSAYLLERLIEFFAARDLKPRNVFELGILDGGSTAFWFEHFRPEKLVAVDRIRHEGPSRFESYVSRHGLENRLKAYWGIDQADRERLLEIVRAEFPRQRLDVVIDDASHELDATRASFETLFPLLRAGGIYLIEDWAWEVLDDSDRRPNRLIELVEDMVKLTRAGIIRTLTVELTFVAAERSRRRHPF